MKNICIMGAGQLGSRHLQALAKVKEQMNIFVIDLSRESLQTAKERFGQVANDIQVKNVFYAQNTDILPLEIDIAIIATTSKGRKTSIFELLRKANVRYMIIEKWLTSKIEDLEEIEQLLISKNVKSWVNCPMRMMPIYEELKSYFETGVITYNVTGTMFGLVTNLIHFVDFIAWMSACNKFSIDLLGINEEIIESKRNDYNELTGTVVIRFNNGSTCVITCNREGEVPLLAQFKNDRHRVILDEQYGKAFWQDDVNNSDIRITDFSVPFQSQMTANVVEELLSTGTCRLTAYHESKVIHMQLMQGITDFLRSKLKYTKEEFPFT